jgi:hypothetical protein
MIVPGGYIPYAPTGLMHSADSLKPPPRKITPRRVGQPLLVGGPRSYRGPPRAAHSAARNPRAASCYSSLTTLGGIICNMDGKTEERPAHPPKLASSLAFGDAMEEKKHFKIVFPLRKDADGYPHDDWETLWAWEINPGSYCIDNIPFFIKGISSGDVVSAERRGEELHFTGLLEPSGNSVFRIYVADQSNVQGVRDELRNLKCESELSHVPNLISVEVPADVPIRPFLSLLVQGARDKRWDYQEGSLRHPL